MKTFYGIAATVLAVSLALPGAAVAGFKLPFNVEINEYFSQATGAVGTARNSRDSRQDIGCGIWAYLNSNYNVGSCWAYDEGGNVRHCTYTSRPDFDKAVTNVSDSSYIHFGWDDRGYCTKVIVLNGAIYEPKGR